MITIVGMFAKARTYMVQTRPYNRRRKNAEADWAHAGQFNYDGKMEVIRNGKKKFIRAGATKIQAEIAANKFAQGLGPNMEYRILNVTVKQAHKAKCKTYRPDGELKKLRNEFDYDRACPLRKKTFLPWVPNKRKQDEKLGTTAITTPETNHRDSNKRDYDRLRKAMAYYEFAMNY